MISSEKGIAYCFVERDLKECIIWIERIKMTFMSVRIMLFLRFLFGLLELYKYRLLLTAFSTRRCTYILDIAVVLVFMIDVTLSWFPISTEGVSQEVLQLLADETCTLQPGYHSRSIQHKHPNVFYTSGLHHFFPAKNIQCSLIPGLTPAPLLLLPGTLCPSCYPRLPSVGTAWQLHYCPNVGRCGKRRKRC